MAPGSKLIGPDVDLYTVNNLFILIQPGYVFMDDLHLAFFKGFCFLKRKVEACGGIIHRVYNSASELRYFL